MKKTYIFMLLAALSLAAAPLITLGFWSKDAIFASVLESGYVHSLPLFIIALVVAMMTAFYTFRMIGMSFFGNKSDHLEQLEKAGHTPHEVGPIVWVPFAILAVATIGIGVVGFAFGAELQHIFTGYLANYFGITEQKQLQESTTTHIVQPHTEPKLFLGLNPIAASASFGAFAVGGFLGYMFYISRKMDPQIISKNVVTRAIWKFLYNRWYLNSAIYWGTVIGPVAIYRIGWRYFELAVMERVNHAFEFLMASFSRVVKAGQTGITQTYLFVFGVGIMLIIMLLLL
jgi:NADH-quinone oxidoreductase subunit L